MTEDQLWRKERFWYALIVGYLAFVSFVNGVYPGSYTYWIFVIGSVGGILICRAMVLKEEFAIGVAILKHPEHRVRRSVSALIAIGFLLYFPVHEF